MGAGGGMSGRAKKPLTPALSPEGRGGAGTADPVPVSTTDLAPSSPRPSGERVRVRGAALKSISDLEAAHLIAVGGSLAPVAEKYAIGITPAILDLIDPSDPEDPIARQFVPSAAELVTTPEERADPIGDLTHSPVEGIVHRYPDRVLLKAVHICPVYCRFCFRREMVGPQGLGTLTPAELDAAMAYIADHDEIWEVILTGGDPLVLSPRRLRAIMERLAGIAHVKVVRFHTRVPVVEPERIDADMVAALRANGKTTYLAVHANHPRELSAAARAGFDRLIAGGIVLISQSVLLRGVNDDVETLAALMRGFVENRIRPYYLHHPDLALGTGHFRVSIEEGQALVAALRGRISGLAQPTYVLDIPGGHGKADIGAASIVGSDGCFTVRDWQGGEHTYPPV
jgi:lysine-2,3-aminomutase-related protein